MSSSSTMPTRLLPPSLAALSLALLPFAPLNAATPPQATTPVAAAAASAVQPSSALPPITHDVYATWRSIQHTQLSRDGQWIAYALVAQEADGELVVRRVADGREYRAPRGTAPQFSADGRFVAFAVQPTRAEIDKAKKDKKKGEDAPKPGAAWMDLATGKVETVERVKRFGWGKDGGVHLAMLLEAPAKKDGAKDPKAPAARADSEAGTAGEVLVDTELDAGTGRARADAPLDQEAPVEGGARTA